jgi:hypothetical protein
MLRDKLVFEERSKICIQKHARPNGFYSVRFLSEARKRA